MLTKRTEAFSTSSGAATGELLALLVASLVRLLRAGGVNRNEIMDAVARALGAENTTSHPVQPVSLGQAQRDCMEVMCWWRRDPDFLTEDGLPAPLSLDSGMRSFRELCSRVRVMTNAADLLETLKTFGAIRIADGNQVIPETPTFLLSAGPGSIPLAFDGVLKQIAGFVRGIEHNVLDADVSNPRRFERACTVVIAEELLPVFERLVAGRGQDFIDVLDEWLERHSTAASQRNRYVEVGVGAYFVNHGVVEK